MAISKACINSDLSLALGDEEDIKKAIFRDTGLECVIQPYLRMVYFACTVGAVIAVNGG